MFVLILILIVLITVGLTVTFGVLWDNTKKENLQLKEILAEKIDAEVVKFLLLTRTIPERRRIFALSVILWQKYKRRKFD